MLQTIVTVEDDGWAGLWLGKALAGKALVGRLWLGKALAGRL